MSKQNSDFIEVFLINRSSYFHAYRMIIQRGTVVHARGGCQVQPHHSIKNHPLLDVPLVVGGLHDEEVSKAEVLGWISQQAKSVSLLASVCTWAFLLAAAGV